MLTLRQIETVVLALRSRHGRKKSDLCICEGLRASRELVARASHLIEGCVLRDDVLLNFSLGIEPFRVPEHWFEKYAPTQNSQGILFLTKRPSESVPTSTIESPFVLALDGVNDPGNLGTILRSLSAAGLSELWLTRGSVDPFSDKAIRAGMGMQFSMKISYFEDLSEMATRAPLFGVTGPMWLTTPHQGPALYDVPDLFDRTVVVMGGEANGIVRPPPDPHWVSLPMPGAEESLNVAQCATVFIFEYVRRLSTQTSQR